MGNNMYTYTIATKRDEQFIDITHLVRETVEKNGMDHGIVTVFCPHTTAGITINENADPDVKRDIIVGLNKIFPVDGDYRHFEGNSHAHLKASTVGSSCTVVVSDGNLVLGTWQSVYFCEFDGPRNRKVIISMINA